MSPEAQRVAIAEACGWKHIGYNGMTMLFNNPNGLCVSDCPNYLTDLNAMREAEKVLGARDWKYVEELRKLSDGDLTYNYTAAQRAEAFLKTLGLWTEGAGKS